MTSFMQTMFVPASISPQRSHFPYAAKPLTPLHSNVLAASESCIHLLHWPDDPQHVYESPLHKHFKDVLNNASPSFSSSTSSHALLFSNHSRLGLSRPVSPTKPQHKPLHRHTQSDTTGRFGLGNGLDSIGMQADLLTHDSNSNARTRGAFKPQRAAKGTNSWQLKQFAEATLGSGSLRKVVKLPEGEDKDEWLAVNVVDFYNQVNLLYGAITEFCSPQSCPEMKATDEFEYLWHNPPAFPKPTRLPAPTYISHLLTWTQTLLSDPNLFPTHPGVSFPANFQSTVKQIFKRLYRIYAHIYCHHYGVIRGLGLEAHLNTGFKHYVLFVEEFNLADDGGKGGKARQEWFGPLGDLVESMLRSD